MAHQLTGVVVLPRRVRAALGLPGPLGELADGQLPVQHQPEDGPAAGWAMASMLNRNPDVDQWFDHADHPLDAALRRARDIVLGADGRVTESIKWKTPTVAYRGNIASFNPSKHVVSIMFRAWCDWKAGSPTSR